MEVKTVFDLLITKEVNKAGCYAIKLYVNGIEHIIVIDDWFPIKYDKSKKLGVAFTKSSKGENEIWMLLIEKAIAKLFGSYEAMEKEICGLKEGETSLTRDFEKTGDFEIDYKKE
jgi:hypothetical protein